MAAFVGLAPAATALDESVTIDFDQPEFAAGETVSLVGDVGFVPAGKVFAPTRVATFSGNQALRVADVCATPDCLNGAYRLGIRFGQPLPAPAGAWLWRHASRVAMRIGADSVNTPCVPEGTACAIYARLSGFDEQGNRAADSRDVFVLDSFSATSGAFATPITREIEIRDPSARIVRVTLVYGKDTFAHDSIPLLPGEPQIDHLEVTFPDVPPGDTRPPAPTVQISEPANGSQRPYPFQMRLRGSVSVPGGLAAFCYRVGPSPASAPSESECRNNADLKPDSTFDIPIDDSALNAGANAVSVTVYDLWGRSATSTVTFTANAPPPPRITITSPRDFQWLSATQSTPLSGSVATVGALKGFCVLVDATAMPAPGACLSDLVAVQSTNPSVQPLLFSTSLSPQRFTPGAHRVSVFAVDRWDQIGREDIAVNLPTDFRVAGMEISQGIQTLEIPLNVNGSAPYTGVKLRQGVPTVVRVFANTSFPGSHCCASMLLAGFRPDPQLGERQLGTLLPDSTPSALSSGPLDVPFAMRANPNGGFVFTLPRDWTLWNGVRLRASLQLPFSLQECTGCTGNNAFSVTGINFGSVMQFVISPMALVYTNASGVTMAPPSPHVVFAPVINISPVPSSTVTLSPYVAIIDVTDVVSPSGGCRFFTTTCQDTVFGRVTAFEVFDHPGLTIGVGPIDVGLTHLQPISRFPAAIEPIAVADSRLPLTAVGHELYHELNYFHAGPDCPGVDLWNYWPPDDKGYIQGVGLDRRKLRDSGGRWSGQYRILMPGTQGMPGGQANYYDLMSYCADEDTAWISAHNWNNFGDLLPSGSIPDSLINPGGTIIPPAAGSRRDAVEVDGGTLVVSAVIDKTGRASSLQARSSGNWLPVASDKDATDFVFVVRGARRAVLARVPALVTELRGHGAAGSYVAAIVPAKGAATVALEHQSETIGVLERSASAPKLRLDHPVADSVSRDASLRIDWTASDSERQAVEIRIEYSAGTGKPFRPVYAGPNRGSAIIPASMLEAAAQGRLRVVASDGFNATTVTTRSITVRATHPQLTILAPRNNTSFPRNTPIRLEAAAFGNNLQPLRKKQLTWFVDNRRAGRGQVLERKNLKPGRHVARVVARDGKLISTRRVTFTIRPSNIAATK